MDFIIFFFSFANHLKINPCLLRLEMNQDTRAKLNRRGVGWGIERKLVTDKVRAKHNSLLISMVMYATRTILLKTNAKT